MIEILVEQGYTMDEAIYYYENHLNKNYFVVEHGNNYLTVPLEEN